MQVGSSWLTRGRAVLWCASLPLFLGGCDDTAEPSPGAGGSSALGGAGNAGMTTSAGAGGGGASTGGAGAASGGVSGSAGSVNGGGGGSASGTGGGGSAQGGNAAGSGGVGGSAGAAGGGAGAGNGGAAGSGGASTCDTLDKANDGSYVRSGWSADYACTGGTCPAKSQADKGDVETNAFDADYQSRWSTGVYQSALAQQKRFPLSFTVDLKKAVPVSKLSTHPGCKDYYDSPGTIEVEVSTDGTNFTTVTASPHTPAVPSNEACPPSPSSVATDTISFPTTCARYVRLKGTQRTTSDRYWAIGDMKIYP